MNIEIRLFSTLAPYARHPEVSPENILSLAVTATIRDAIKHLGLPEEKIKLIFLNGVHASLDATLSDGDRVGIFPPIGGG